MTTSGTTAFDLDIADIIEDAYEIVGGEARAGYDLRTARRSLNLLKMEWGNRGLNLWTIANGSLPISAGVDRATLPANIIDVIEAVWRTGTADNPNDRSLTRISISQRSQITEKLEPGTPTQYYVYRSLTPEVNIWPVPTEDGIFAYWYLRTIQDAGAYTNTIDVPGRFLPALVNGLAYYLAMKTPGAAERVPVIQAEYERQFQLAAEEDRDRSSFFMLPDLSAYSR